MKNADAAAAYRSATFDNAPPIKILRMLYEGAIRFLKYAQDHEPGSEEYRKYLRQADEILSELRATLDHEPAPEVAANLENLYLFSQTELGEAFIHGQKERIQPVIEVLQTLLEGWKSAQAELGHQSGAA